MHPTLRTATLALLGLSTAGAAICQQWTTEALSAARGSVGAVTVGDLALFAGGNVGLTPFDVVDVHDASTGLWSTTALSVPRGSVGAAALGDHAFFGGGFASGASFSDVVDVLHAPSLTWTTATLSQARYQTAAAAVGDKVLFAGGQQAFGSTSDVVDIYDATLGPPSDPAAWSTTTLSRARAGITAVSVGGKVVFAGGWLAPGGVPVDDVDIYDDATGLWTTANLSVPRILGPDGGVAAAGRAYFGGGHTSAMGGPNMSEVVDVYDPSSGSWSTLQLSLARGYVGVTAIGSTVLFAGGSATGHVQSDLVELLNAGTGQWLASESLSLARRGPATTTVAGKAIFAGGSGVSGNSLVVDVYEPLGVSYCTPNPNSTGVGATIHAAGSKSVLVNDLVLRGTSLPASSFGFFLTSRAKGLVANPGGSQGVLCLGGSIGRYVGPGQIQNSGLSGEISLTLDLPSTPTPTGLVAVQVGETWNFQAWYRDVGGVSNFTDAIAVEFR